MEMKPIGFVRSEFKTQKGTPIQPAYAEGTVGEIVLEPAFAEGLTDLAGFERIWVLFELNQAAPFRLRVVPYKDTAERGLFATRAPSRPNPIGLSAVKLLRIEKNVLYITELDILDGSPVFDIKPYIPQFDSFPNSKAGWLDGEVAERRNADNRFEQEKKNST